MKHTWVSLLTAAEPARFYSSLGCRKRAEAAVGRSAVMWAVRAGQRMADNILQELTDWTGDRDDEEFESLRRATEASTIDTVAALYTGDKNWLARSTEPSENVAFYVARSIPLDQVVRNVHAGQTFVTDELMNALEQAVPEHERLATAKQLTRDVSACWSSFVQALSKRYAEEAARRLTSQSGLTAEAVRTILRDEGPVPDDVVAQLPYQLRQSHTALVVWLEDAEPDTFRHFAWEQVTAQLARLTQAKGGTLIHNEGVRHVLIWLGSRGPLDTSGLELSGTWPSPLRIAVGTTGQGLAGFRQSHREALAAERVARLVGRSGTVTRYEEVELLSLLLADTRQSAAFVRRTLGPKLAVPDDRARELRRTLLHYLDNKGSLALTAAALHTHRNTVAYRIRQINEVLPPAAPSYQVRCALELAETVPGTVLSDGTESPFSQGGPVHGVLRPQPATKRGRDPQDKLRQSTSPMTVLGSGGAIG
ncbi:helix-turn-helix domain-containing protein [Arthrobacter sp. I2-34]|uniref:Helix-turn-helix domain-containing protein n=1 Tax=Arthrobacter hankyongi TaxID=2904801 RepID=A0ABS9L8P4_9MICC|nr:helix-turn-helix domain-containing protein [Arthrobacter hankyongi]MCG2622971.1 helix-turn-helix domain-containing protein [Arthrobacter hankyongi]